MCTQQSPWNPVESIGIHWDPMGPGGILGSRDTVGLLRQQHVEPFGIYWDPMGSGGIPASRDTLGPVRQEQAVEIL